MQEAHLLISSNMWQDVCEEALNWIGQVVWLLVCQWRIDLSLWICLPAAHCLGYPALQWLLCVFWLCVAAELISPANWPLGHWVTRPFCVCVPAEPYISYPLTDHLWPVSDHHFLCQCSSGSLFLPTEWPACFVSVFPWIPTPTC